MSFFLLLIESFFVRSSVPLLAIVIYVYLSWISFNRLRKCKGPTLARFSSLWLFNAIGTKRADLELFDVSEKCGDLARIGPDLLLTGDAEVVIRMNAARSRYTKSNWYAGQKVEADHDNMFSTLDETRHSKRRAQMAIGASLMISTRINSQLTCNSTLAKKSMDSKLWSTSTCCSSSLSSKKNTSQTMEISNPSTSRAKPLSSPWTQSPKLHSVIHGAV